MDNSISPNSSNSKKAELQKFAEKVNYIPYDISNTIYSPHYLMELYQSIYDSLNKLIALPNFFIALYDAQTKMINLEYFIAECDEKFPIIERKYYIRKGKKQSLLSKMKTL